MSDEKFDVKWADKAIAIGAAASLRANVATLVRLGYKVKVDTESGDGRPVYVAKEVVI